MLAVAAFPERAGQSSIEMKPGAVAGLSLAAVVDEPRGEVLLAKIEIDSAWLENAEINVLH